MVEQLKLGPFWVNVDYYLTWHLAAARGRRSLSLADFSWPQAAMISRPRGLRIGAE